MFIFGSIVLTLLFYNKLFNGCFILVLAIVFLKKFPVVALKVESKIGCIHIPSNMLFYIQSLFIIEIYILICI